MWTVSIALLACGGGAVAQLDNSTLPFPSSVYPGAESPNPAAQVLADFSPPYYPSPWASGAGGWGDAYAKARGFVSQLTLLEKVNLTTGVGYVQCPAGPVEWNKRHGRC